jgi:hypothetical protein
MGNKQTTPLKIEPVHIKPIHINIPKPKIDFEALRKTTSIIVGVISIMPLGGKTLKSVIGIADGADHGKASQYLNDGYKTNGTLDMVPGGMLAQSIANFATHGKSGDELNRYVPDPKNLIQKEVFKSVSTLHQSNNVANTPSKPSLFNRTSRVVSSPVIHSTLHSTINIPKFNTDNMNHNNTLGIRKISIIKKASLEYFPQQQKLTKINEDLTLSNIHHETKKVIVEKSENTLNILPNSIVVQKETLKSRPSMFHSVRIEEKKSLFSFIPPIIPEKIPEKVPVQMTQKNTTLLNPEIKPVLEPTVITKEQVTLSPPSVVEEKKLASTLGSESIFENKLLIPTAIGVSAAIGLVTLL